MTEKQKRYLELAGDPAVEKEETEEAGGWILVEYRPSDDVVAAVAEAERTVAAGERVRIADEYVWVDREGREHFGPDEIGYDRFELSS